MITNIICGLIGLAVVWGIVTHLAFKLDKIERNYRKKYGPR